MPKFTATQPNLGFDEANNLHMVPKGGARGFNLIGGDDLTIDRQNGQAQNAEG